MDAGGVGNFAHQAVQRVDFPHQMPFANAANGRVTGHLTQPVGPVGDEQRKRAKAGGSGCCFRAGMAATNNDDIVFHARVLTNLLVKSQVFEQLPEGGVLYSMAEYK
jgi:hypothetical protein